MATTPPVPGHADPALDRTGDELADRVQAILVEEGRRYLAEVPRASHLTDEAPLDVGYYVRHRIETIWRIWLTARTDALALASMLDEDYDSAREWSRYIAEELDHDTMFLADLTRHGVTVEDVRSTRPFPATRAMLAEMETEIARVGSIPAVAYSLFVEWNADRFSGRAVEKARAALSDAHVAGARRHADFDRDESHLPMILRICRRLIDARADRAKELERSVRSIAAHFRAYFTELDAACR